MEILIFFFLILVIIFMFWFEANQRNECKKKIKNLVVSKGGRNVVIVRTGAGGQDHVIYSVTYTDPDGQTHRVKCKARVSLMHGPELYWDENPIPDMNNYKERQAETHKAELDAIPLPKSSKEQIIDDLTTENERLQAELAQYRRQQHN